VPYVHYSFSPWGGCSEVSEGCKNCFAKDIDRRFYGGNHWEDNGLRRMQTESYWAQPLAWERLAAQRGQIRRVLCGTMCDPCDPHMDLDPLRRRLEGLIAATPHLFWMFLSKRPQRYGLIGAKIREAPNVLLGVTAETQARADQRLPDLLAWSANGYWVSVEPMLTPVTLAGYTDRLELVVCGDESGGARRPARLGWVRALRDETRGVAAFFFKQWHFTSAITICPELDGERWIETPIGP
jgi:protein gp37